MATFSWNLVADIQEMWSLPFMLNAFRAGTIAAVLAAVVGWFMVLRRQTFAGHTLALVGFPGAAAAVWLGLSVTAGYFAFCWTAALIIGARPGRIDARQSAQSAVIGTVQSFCLAAGMLFVALYGGFLSGTTALLFGSFLGITAGQVMVLAIAAAAALLVLALVGRPLLFTSVDADVARAHGAPTRLLGLAFLLLLGTTAAEVSQITGALLVFALLVLPPATAQALSARPAHSLILSVLTGLITVWVALFIAYYTPYPVGFWLTTVGFALYLATKSGAAAAGRVRRRPALPTTTASASASASAPA